MSQICVRVCSTKPLNSNTYQTNKMIDKIKNLLNPSASKTTELTFTRDVLVAGVHHAAGTTDTFSQKDAAQLVGSGCAFNPAADDEAANGKRDWRQ